MIFEYENHADNPANTIENQNLEKLLFVVLIFGIKITAEISDENQQQSRPSEYLLLQHKKTSQKSSH